MKASPCPDKEILFGYLVGTIPEDEAAAVAEHLAQCGECERTAEALERLPDTMVSALRQRVQSDPYAEEPQCRRVMEALRSFNPDGPEPRAPEPAQPPAPKPRRVTTLGDYELLKKLGQGGMGTVYKARHTRLKKVVALKVLPKDRLTDPDAVARFEREMEAVGRLDHPHIVRAMDAREVEGIRFLVMEYVDGLDLSEVVRRCGPLGIADACEVIRQAALGLQCSQENGLVHRDIKPSNLMLTASGEVKVLDLGLAQIQEAEALSGEITGVGQVMGTPDYLSPEQALESHTVDIRSDIYSLGCTLYYLLAGHAPFSGPEYDTPMKKVAAHLHNAVPSIQLLRSDLPKPIAALVERMLAKHPQQRIGTPSEVVNALAPFCKGSKLVGLLREARSRGPSSDETEGVSFETGEVRESALIKTSREKAESQKPTAEPPAETEFDPYHRWLGIPPEEQPANHYRLLGMATFESDPEVIRDAAARQMAHVRTYHLGPHAELSQKILNELAGAKGCLLDQKKKNAYDAGLHEKLIAEGPRAVQSLEPVAAPPVVAMALPRARMMAPPVDEIIASPPVVISWRPVRPARRASPKRITRLRMMAVVATAIASLVLALLLGVVLRIRTAEGTLVLEISEPDATVDVSAAEGKVVIHQQAARGDLTIGLDPGKYRLRVEKDGFSIFTKEISIASRGKEVISAKLEPLPSPAQQTQPRVAASDSKPPLDSTAASATPTQSPLGVPQPSPESPPTPSSRGDAPPPAVAPFDAAKAKEHQENWAKHVGTPVEITNSIGMNLVLIPAGEFLMGSPDSDKDAASDEKPQHRVQITKPFYLGKYEVTLAQYERVMGTNPSNFKGDPQRPVEKASWEDATEFCRRLSQKEDAAYRLPTEAEWEYACRAGSTTRYCFGDEESTLGDYAWFNRNANSAPHPVGEKNPNAWKLFDMHGNVWEWCADGYYGGYNASSPPEDPAGPTAGLSRVLRGGAFGSRASNVRSALRDGDQPGDRLDDIGFRPARTLAAETVSGASALAGPTATSPATTASAQTGLTPPLAIAPFDGKKAKEHQGNWAKHLGVPMELANSIGMKLVLIPPGEFLKGSPDIPGYPKERPQLRVRITKPFYLGRHEVTQAQYERVMGTNPSGFKGDPARPVETVTWQDATEFCRRLSQKEGVTYRLPTEAEWEYASRAGSTTKYYFGNEESALHDYAWTPANAGSQTHPVGLKKPNAWEIYDTHGNVWEWCVNSYSDGYYAASPEDDPIASDPGARPVLRGGSWDVPLRYYVGSASRAMSSLNRGLNSHGFRLARTLAAGIVPGALASTSIAPGGKEAIAARVESSTVPAAVAAENKQQALPAVKLQTKPAAGVPSAEPQEGETGSTSSIQPEAGNRRSGDFGRLVQDVTQMSGADGCVFGPVFAASDEWQGIVAGDDDSSRPSTVVMARFYGAGRVVILGHPTLVVALDVLDNGRFVENMVSWLDVRRKKSVLCFRGGPDAVSPARFASRLARGRTTVGSLAGEITAAGLARASVLIVANSWDDFAPAEIEVVRQFVQRGGGLCLGGLGWSWAQYHPDKKMSDYPMMKLAQPYEAGWLASTISDPTHQHKGTPIFHTFYPNIQ